MVTRELGELRIMVWRSKLCSDSGEMVSGRFLLGRDGIRGLGNRESARGRGVRVRKGLGQHTVELHSWF
jgi:hypothetical protein